MNQIKALRKRPGEAIEEIMIDNTLPALQEAVGGYIEVVMLDIGIVLICNEEGKIRGLPHNVFICGEHIVGTFLIVGTDGEEFADCPMTKETFEMVYM